jgi:hypothetical protein
VRAVDVLRNCIADEGRPLETGFQEQVSNCLPLLLPKGGGGERRRKRLSEKLGQVTFRKRNASEPPHLRVESNQTISKPRSLEIRGTSSAET